MEERTSRFFEIGIEGKLKPVPALQDAVEAYQHGAYVWFILEKASHTELDVIAAPLGLHPLSVEDCLDEDQIPKIDNYPTNTFILVNQYRYADNELDISEVDLFLGERFLVSVNFRMEDGSRYYQRLEESTFHDPRALEKSMDVLLHVILDYIVDEKIVAIEALQEEIDSSEEEIINDAAEFNPATLMGLRRDLLKLRKSLFHEREVLMKICRRDSSFITEKAIYHFRDVYDHLAKFFEVTEMYHEMISNLMEMYFSIQNNKMTLAANRTNQVVRRLTFITTVFMPLTLLAGIGGMSEWTMITGPDNWKLSYPLLILVMILIGVFSYYMLKKSESKDRGEGTEPV